MAAPASELHPIEPSRHITLKQRRLNVDSTSTLNQRCFDVACPLGGVHFSRNNRKYSSSEDSAQSAQNLHRIAKDAKFLHADNEDSDQITRMRRLV